VLVLAVGLGGLRKSLPHAPEVDEPFVVRPAALIAATGDLNPRWFGHPGSTLIYPLALILHARDALAEGDPPLRPHPAALERRRADMTADFLAGRLLVLAHWAASIPLLFVLGRRVFGARAALLGAALAAALPTPLAHGQLARTDLPAVLYTLLALWLAVRVVERPTAGRLLLLGAAIGLAVATRFLLVALLPLLPLAWGLGLWATRRRPGGWALAAPAAGLGAAAAALAASSPFLVLDRERWWRDLALEGETHLGAESLGAAGNALWYVGHALPATLTWPVAALAVAGLALAVARRDPRALVLLAFAASYLLVIAQPGPRWARWVIPVLPVLALFAGSAVAAASARAARAWGLSARSGGLLAAAVCAVAAAPAAFQAGVHALQAAQPSGRVLAREWLMEHAEPGSRILFEGYNDVLKSPRFRTTTRVSFLPDSPEQLAASGYRYLVVTSATYATYLADRARYPHAAGEYERLLRDGALLAEFRPLADRIGAVPVLGRAECYCTVAPMPGEPVVRIYALHDDKARPRRGRA
jgi:hypothetical protein